MKQKMVIQSLTKYGSLIFFLMVLISSSVEAQLKLNYRNFLVPPNIIYSFQSANGGVTVPASGPNQTWDYSTLVKSPGITAEPYIPETNAFFPTARRQRLFMAYYGAGFYANAYEHSSSNTTSYKVIGQSTNRSAYSIGSITGNTNDSLIVLAQNISYNGNKLAIPYSCMYLSNWLYTYDYKVDLQISLASQGLNHAPLKFSTIIVEDRNVTGWGDMRIPTVNGPSAYISSLLIKTTRTQTDSFFVNGTPASSAVLNVLGFAQGQISNQYLYHFKRAGLEQDLATFYFIDSTFNTVDRVLYDRRNYDLYCNNDNCHAKMCLDGVNTVCLPYSNNSANNEMLFNGAHLGACEATRQTDANSANGIVPQLFPNPSNNQFTLLLNDDGESTCTVSIFDMSGREIKKFEDVNGMIEFGSDLTPGIYLAMIETGLHKQVIKMIKTK